MLRVVIPPQNDKHPEHGSGCMKMVNVLFQVYFLFLYFAQAYVEGETYSLTVRMEGRWNGPSYKYKIVNKVQRTILKHR